MNCESFCVWVDLLCKFWCCESYEGIEVVRSVFTVLYRGVKLRSVLFL